MDDALQRISTNSYESFFLISGPCAIESYDICAQVAETCKQICDELKIPYIFKASFRKANRTKANSFTGVGDEKALQILADIKQRFKISITTDVHEISDVQKVKGIVDLIQIPAFLCRQTDLLTAAGKSGIPVNIKKGQFMSGEMMSHAVDKVNSQTTKLCLVTERGNSFGYQDVIVDARNIAVMSVYAPVVMDCTHSTQRPNQETGVTGGNPSEIELLARVGLSAGAKGLFIETHPNPNEALSDAASMLPLSSMKDTVTRLDRFSQSLNEIYG